MQDKTNEVSTQDPARLLQSTIYNQEQPQTSRWRGQVLHGYGCWRGSIPYPMTSQPSTINQPPRRSSLFKRRQACAPRATFQLHQRHHFNTTSATAKLGYRVATITSLPGLGNSRQLCMWRTPDCFFFVYSTKQSITVVVERDEAFLAVNIPWLQQFYWSTWSRWCTESTGSVTKLFPLLKLQG